MEEQKIIIFFIFALNPPKVANYYPNFTFFYKVFFATFDFYAKIRKKH